MDRLLKLTSRLSLATAVVGSIASVSLYSVDGGECAVLWSMREGIVKNKTYGEGLNWVIPFYQKPYIFDIRKRPTSISTKTGSKDLQTVNISLRVLFKPVVGQLPFLYSEYGMDYDQRILPSIGNEVMKAVVAQYNAEELITRREEVSKTIAKTLRAKSKQFHIELHDISITHLGFSKDFTKAVEDKQIAQQIAERQKYIVEKSGQEKLATIIKGEGEAEAAALIAKALDQGPGFIELRKLQAAKEIAQTLSTSSNVTYLPKDVNLLLNSAMTQSSPPPSSSYSQKRGK
eukprot:gene7591-11914_t